MKIELTPDDQRVLERCFRNAIDYQERCIECAQEYDDMNLKMNVLMNAKSEIVGEIREIQHEKKAVDEAIKGMQLALSCDGIYYGKNVNENDNLYVFMAEEDLAKWEKQMNLLNEEEKQLLQEMKAKVKKYFI